MKAWELIKALEEGKTIIKDYAVAYPEQYQFSGKGEHVQTYYLYEGTKTIFSNGWGSAYFSKEGFLKDLFEYPQYYDIEPPA